MSIDFSARSAQDLADIFHYITDKLHNPTAAQNTVSGILNLANHLSDFPKLGPVIPNSNANNLEIRFVTSGNYLVLYTIEASTVKVIRILYARSDYLRLLGK